MIGMLKVALVLGILTYAVANPVIEDCAGGESALQIHSLTLDPYPIKFPSELVYSVDAEILKVIDNVHVSVDISKIVLAIPIHIPCIDGVGSCTYENVCDLLDIAFPDGCPPDMVENDLQCKCPFQPSRMTYTDLQASLSELPGSIAGLVSGRYKVTLEFIDAASSAVVSCTKLDLRID